MRHRKANKKMERPSDQRMALLRTQSAQLFRHGKIMTTETKAKQLVPFAEKLLHKAKAGDIHSMRMVRRYITDRDILQHLATEVVPKIAGKEGGYITAIKGYNRRGDNAPMALVKLNINK